MPDISDRLEIPVTRNKTGGDLAGEARQKACDRSNPTAIPNDPESQRGTSANLSRLTYRARQFQSALFSSRKQVETEALLPHLTPSQMVLFRRMQPSEQAHAYQVLERLKSAGQTDPDLLTAALLHDVGKILFPLSLPDRVVIVLGKRFFRRKARRWSEGTPSGFRRPFVVAAQHPDWGADLAEQAGASSQTVDLIRRHQDSVSGMIPCWPCCKRQMMKIRIGINLKYYSRHHPSREHA